MFIKDAGAKDPVDYARFQSLTITDKYEKASLQMLRVADIISMIQNKPSINYEYEAALEYYTKGGQQHYMQTMP
jgi:hypothetical protein